MSDILPRFLNEAKQIKQWPRKRAAQHIVLEYLASKFTPGVDYTESQVNEILQSWHTYGDWATLRRALVDDEFLIRKYDGSNYRRINLDH